MAARHPQARQPALQGHLQATYQYRKGNSQSKAAGLARPKVRNIHSVRHLNTLTSLVINARALQRALNATLLTTSPRLLAYPLVLPDEQG